MVLKNAIPSTPTDASTSNQAKLYYTELPPARSSHHQRSTTTNIVTINRQPPKIQVLYKLPIQNEAFSNKIQKQNSLLRICGYSSAECVRFRSWFAGKIARKTCAVCEISARLHCCSFGKREGHRVVGTEVYWRLTVRGRQTSNINIFWLRV